MKKWEAGEDGQNLKKKKKGSVTYKSIECSTTPVVSQLLRLNKVLRFD